MDERAIDHLKTQMDAIYGGLPLDAIPWNTVEPPELLQSLLARRWIVPCDAADLGCGAGNFAVWLAGRGFRVTGFDLSPKALSLARDLARRKGAACDFVERDLTAPSAEFDATFDFAFDWEVLHHVFHEDRQAFVENVHRMLRPKGRYFSLCFSEKDPFCGSGRYRKTPLGTTLCFSSESELKALFEPFFIIQELGTVEVPGKRGPHLAVKALLEKKEPPRSPGGG